MDRLVCPDCGKLFTSKRSLFGHKKEKHSGPVEVFPCTDCGKNFSRKANLKVSNITMQEYSMIITNFQAHRDSLHFGKKFPCSFCDRIFTNRSSMNQHIKKTHSEPVMGLWTRDYTDFVNCNKSSYSPLLAYRPVQNIFRYLLIIQSWWGTIEWVGLKDSFWTLDLIWALYNLKSFI